MTAVSEETELLDRPEAGARAIRGGTIRGIAYIAGILFTAVSVPLMTRHLGRVDFGRFVVASTVVMIVGGVTEFGLSGVATREYALASPQDRRLLLSSLLGLRTVLTGVGLALALGLMVIAGYPGVEIAGMLISGLGLVLLNAEQTYAIALNAQLQWGMSSLFDLINSFVIGAATVLLVLIGAGLLPFFWVSVASSAAALLGAALYLRRRVPLLPRLDVHYWRVLLHDTIPYAVATTVGIFYPRIGLLVTSLASTSFQTTYYSTAYKVVEVVGGTSGLIASSAFPVFARAGRDDHVRLGYATSKVTDTSLIIGAYIVFSLVVAAPFVIDVIGPASFRPAIPVLRLQSIALLAGFLASTWSQTLLSLRMHRAILAVTASALVLAIIVSVVLVPSLGAKGAAIASAAGEFAVAGGYLIALVRAHPKLRPSFAIVPRLALAGAAAFAPMLLGLPSIVSWALGSLVFAALVWTLKVLPQELLAALLPGKPGSAGDGDAPTRGDDG